MSTGILCARPTRSARQADSPSGGSTFRYRMPGVAAAGLLVFITSLGFFIIPALLGGARETMISQVIISTLLELMNWRFAGALALVLLAAAMLVFYLYDRLLGVATLSGERGAIQRPPAAGKGGLAPGCASRSAFGSSRLLATQAMGSVLS